VEIFGAVDRARFISDVVAADIDEVVGQQIAEGRVVFTLERVPDLFLLIRNGRFGDGRGGRRCRCRGVCVGRGNVGGRFGWLCAAPERQQQQRCERNESLHGRTPFLCGRGQQSAVFLCQNARQVNRRRARRVGVRASWRLRLGNFDGG